MPASGLLIIGLPLKSLPKPTLVPKLIGAAPANNV